MPFDADCDSITVQCADCDAIGADVLVDQDVHGQSDLAALEAEAIAAWNTRASDAEITRLTEALRAAEEREKALREALEGMLEYATFSERWQDQHPEYLTIARAELERIADE